MSGAGTSEAPAPCVARRPHILDMIFGRLQVGQLTVECPNGARRHYRGGGTGPSAVLAIRRWRLFIRVALEGDIGFGRAYIDGDWDSPDIPALLALATHNERALSAWRNGRALWLLHRLAHWRRRNTRPLSRRNIAAHYDLGNEFYSAWLDAGMNYSAALYRDVSQTLEEAQAEKNARIAALLSLDGGEHVLEIGCGWGALAEHLVQHHDSRVTGITLSATQQAYAQDRLTAFGRKAKIALQDYRDVGGLYDRVASIEMLEAVGERYWPAYFERLRAVLRPRGTAVLQVITIAAERFDDYRRRPDFIQRYIFPGGMLPTVEIVVREAGRAGLSLLSHEAFGASYAHTLADWRRRFEEAWPALAAQGFNARFKRRWRYYLSYCEAGFRAGAIDVGLFTLRADPPSAGR